MEVQEEEDKALINAAYDGRKEELQSMEVRDVDEATEIDIKQEVVCDNNVSNFHRLQHLLQDHNKGINFTSEICIKAFKTRRDLTIHGRNHRSVKKHKCNQCGKSFHTNRHLERHLATHTNERKSNDSSVMRHLNRKLIVQLMKN